MSCLLDGSAFLGLWRGRLAWVSPCVLWCPGRAKTTFTRLLASLWFVFWVQNQKFSWERGLKEEVEWASQGSGSRSERAGPGAGEVVRGVV